MAAAVCNLLNLEWLLGEGRSRQHCGNANRDSAIAETKITIVPSLQWGVLSVPLPMTISLQPEQEQFIQAQLATGRYADVAEVIATALQLLEKRSQYDRWIEDVRVKIDLAAAQLDRGEGVDGETAIAQLRAKLQRSREV